jgi:hypothetical protein
LRRLDGQAEDVTVEKQQCARGLVLCGRAHVALVREMLEERGQRISVQFGRMPLAME